MASKGYLVLETGEVWEGKWMGDKRPTEGEVVFNTSMTGYQEIITDPSYAGQMIVFCYPLIGNYGINDIDFESCVPHLAGVITGEDCEAPSHFQSIQSLHHYLEHQGVAGLSGIDTRALVKTIRKQGTMKGKLVFEIPSSLEWGKTEPSHVPVVSVTQPITYEQEGPHIILIDFGYKKSILDYLLKLGCKVTVVPYNTSFDTVKGLKPDGIMLSNGPGNPEGISNILPAIQQITSTYPTFGICLGHQLLALAYGATTSKLTYGHRGANHPVQHVDSGKVYITSQNHGYEVNKTSLKNTPFIPTYHNINDGSVEGMKHHTLPIASVQFHPEAHAGPSDTEFMFRDFIELVGESTYATTS
ncbi:carbamoyl phosphate synthase small subunit [Pontibacillus salicampi]|uniref:Carbamoyl phosphate synthase small chain n=1 Tax=Pontibacillus salicampi TaxID=1449801 RepID=A0ABV6LS30_9BACI